jgi:hypothetical protein
MVGRVTRCLANLAVVTLANHFKEQNSEIKDSFYFNIAIPLFIGFLKLTMCRISERHIAERS